MPTAICCLDCTIFSCGDGVIDPQSNEARDEGSASYDCLFPSCGDGIPDYISGEAGDVSDAMSTATCRVDCTVPMCGDGIFDSSNGEVCDKVGNMPSATCRSDCTFPCCGDGGKVDNPTDEACDEGSANMPSSICCADQGFPWWCGLLYHLSAEMELLMVHGGKHATKTLTCRHLRVDRIYEYKLDQDVA